MDTISGVGVLDKAVLILDAVAEHSQTLPDLQASTGIPRATAHRLASALEAHGLLRREGGGRYELGYRLHALGRVSSTRFPLADIARPVMEALRDATGESVQLFVREGSQRRCVVSLESTHGLRWVVPEGALFPLDVGSSGRLLDGATSRQGWIESIGERESGVASVSAPVTSQSGSVLGALSVSGPTERLSRRPGRRFGSAVARAAAQIRVT